MKKILLIILLLLSLISMIHAAEKTVSGNGTAVIVDGDEKKAREEARTEALIDAIRQATGVTITVETTAKNFDTVEEIMQAQTKGKVISFTPVMDKNVNGTYVYAATVVIEVPDEPKKEEIQNTTSTNDLIIKDVVLIGYNGNEEIVVIPEGVKSIDNSAFSDKQNLRKIVLPKSITSIGDEAFKNCENLKDINLEDTINYIGKSAFWNCQSLNEINIPKNLKIIEEKSFECCCNLEKITIPNGVIEIKDYAFCPCYYNEENIELIGKGNNKLKKLVIPGSVTKIGERVFESYISLEELIIEDGVKEIGECAFLNDVSKPNKFLKKLIIPGSVESIGKNSFQCYPNLEELIIEEGVKIIDNGAFLNGENDPNKLLKKLVIPGSVEKLGKSAFLNFYNLEELIIEDGVKKIDDYAFLNDVSKPNKFLKKLVIPGSVESIGKNSFQCYPNLEELIIEDGVKIIDNAAFLNDGNISNKSLKKLLIPGSVESIGKNSFQCYPNLEELIIEEGVKKIEEQAFVCFKEIPNKTLKKLIIPGSVETIGKFAFQYHPNIEELIIEDGVKK